MKRNSTAGMPDQRRWLVPRLDAMAKPRTGLEAITDSEARRDVERLFAEQQATPEAVGRITSWCSQNGAVDLLGEVLRECSAVDGLRIKTLFLRAPRGETEDGSTAEALRVAAKFGPYDALDLKGNVDSYGHFYARLSTATAHALLDLLAGQLQAGHPLQELRLRSTGFDRLASNELIERLPNMPGLRSVCLQFATQLEPDACRLAEKVCAQPSLRDLVVTLSSMDQASGAMGTSLGRAVKGSRLVSVRLEGRELPVFTHFLKEVSTAGLDCPLRTLELGQPWGWSRVGWMDRGRLEFCQAFVEAAAKTRLAVLVTADINLCEWNWNEQTSYSHSLQGNKHLTVASGPNIQLLPGLPSRTLRAVEDHAWDNVLGMSVQQVMARFWEKVCGTGSPEAASPPALPREISLKILEMAGFAMGEERHLNPSVFIQLDRGFYELMVRGYSGSFLRGLMQCVEAGDFIGFQLICQKMARHGMGLLEADLLSLRPVVLQSEKPEMIDEVPCHWFEPGGPPPKWLAGIA